LGVELFHLDGSALIGLTAEVVSPPCFNEIRGNLFLPARKPDALVEAVIWNRACDGSLKLL
jgi:hypothetical protein